MTYVTNKTTMTEREYLQRLSEKGYTVLPPNLMTIDDILYLYKQIDELKAEVKNLDEGAKLMHSLATGGEQSVLSRLDNGVDAVDAQRWQDAPEYKEAQQVSDNFNFDTVTEQEF